jgi:D-arabinose 1-dehydrogenase-like Zn-dependent alcohol dehydrogenase
MRAVVMRDFGDADVLELDEVADPAPGPGEALVRVGAVEVSSTRDIATRTGRHPFSAQVSLPHVLGGDFAGLVQAVGSGVDADWVGRRVAVANSVTCGTCAACRSGHQDQCARLTMLGIHRWGSYAELVAAPVTTLYEVPKDVSIAAAAAMAATGPIALTQCKVGRVSNDTWLLVTGVTGALGTMLAVLGAELGARVIGLSRRPEAIPSELPLAARLDVGDPELEQALAKVTKGAGVDVVADNVADGEGFARYFPSLAAGARIVVSGAIGAPVLSVPAGPFYVRSLSLLGVRTTTPRDIDEFWRLVGGGLRLPEGLVHTLPLADAAAAHARITEGRAVGHTVLRVSG